MATVSGVPTISGGIFQFLTGGYTPPTWSGGEYSWQVTTVSDTNCYQMWVDSNTQWVDWSDAQWGECYAGLLNQIWTDEYYVYAAIDFGLEVIDIVTEMKVAYIDYSGGFNSVWANDERVYLATTNSGIKYLDKTCISGSMMSPYDLGMCLTDYLTPYDITSSNVKYIHGNDDTLICCTASGVDVLAPTYRSYTLTTEAQKCFLAANNQAYYTAGSGTVWSVRRNSSLTDWTTPDKIYDTGGNVFAAGLRINDIYVADALFVATSSGIYVIDEDSEQYEVYFTSEG